MKKNRHDITEIVFKVVLNTDMSYIIACILSINSVDYEKFKTNTLLYLRSEYLTSQNIVHPK